MAGWREHKAKARAKIHETFEVPAVYLTHVGGTPVRTLVRLHTKTGLEQNEFTWPATGQIFTMIPKIVFKAADVPRVRVDALLIVSATEIYRMGASEPAREGFANAECVALSPQECADTVAAIEPSGAVWQGILP